MDDSPNRFKLEVNRMKERPSGFSTNNLPRMSLIKAVSLSVNKAKNQVFTSEYESMEESSASSDYIDDVDFFATKLKESLNRPSVSRDAFDIKINVNREIEINSPVINRFVSSPIDLMKLPNRHLVSRSNVYGNAILTPVMSIQQSSNISMCSEDGEEDLGRIKHGQMFGHDALINKIEKYTTCAKSIGNSECLKIPKDIFDSVFNKYEQIKYKERSEYVLNKFPFMADNYMKTKIDHAFKDGWFMEYDANRGATLIAENQETHKMYLIKEGTCVIYKTIKM